MSLRKKPESVQFLDSFNANTALVAPIISRLKSDLTRMHYPRNEIDEIILAIDEALTNAIQDTLKKHFMCTSLHEAGRREITLRYNISDMYFDATIIDHGTGLDLLKSMKKIPDPSSKDYFNQVVRYSAEKSQSPAAITINGEDVPLQGVGAGLKILSTFMDSITIDLIDQKNVMSDSVSDSTDGTILTIRRKRRYQ